MCSSARECLTFNGLELKDAINFGFSYVGSNDRLVSYVVANSSLMKDILKTVPESVIKLEDGFLGEMWTAKLVVSDRLNGDRMLFSDDNYLSVIDLHLDRDRDSNQEVDRADV
jgi:regulator of extracellular matrix RemA (YlzA/DUF370 family)